MSPCFGFLVSEKLADFSRMIINARKRTLKLYFNIKFEIKYF